MSLSIHRLHGRRPALRRDRPAAWAEPLEARRLLAAFVVNNAGDGADMTPGDGVAETALGNGVATLRAAIMEGIGQGTATDITFSLARGTVIQTAGLPTVTVPLDINGDVGGLGSPGIVLDGNGGGGTGLALRGGNSRVRGLVIQRFNGDGIVMDKAGDNTIVGNYIGTDITGSLPRGNGRYGIVVRGTTGNTIGDFLGTAKNVIAANGFGGIRLDTDFATLPPGRANDNAVHGNHIGIDVTGQGSGVDLGNGGDGIYMNDAARNTISDNVISDNNGDGVAVVGEATIALANLIIGNFIGTDRDGDSPFGNRTNGVRLSSPFNTVGGTDAIDRNVISANGFDGVSVGGAENTVKGNVIGLVADGTAALGNGRDGVAVTQGGSFIGGPEAGARNIISGNVRHGIFINNGSGAGNLVRGNYIGTDVFGSADLGNGGDGILVGPAPGHTIGGTAAADRNVISGNGGDGVNLSARGNFVKGNYIGLNAAGAARLGNGRHGVSVAEPGNFIGGEENGARNVISANAVHGIHLANGPGPANIVQGNYIGTNALGTVDRGNDGSGINIVLSPDNVIGGLGSQAGNVISGNGEHGIAVDAMRTVIQGNFIGTDVGGNNALGNGMNGVAIFGGGSTRVGAGGPNGTEGGNLISANGANGIEVRALSANPLLNNVIAGGNLIGTKVNGTAALGNAVNGVLVSNGIATTIGGSEPGQGNVIAFNGTAANRGAGVAVLAVVQNRVVRNSIHSNGGLGIDLGTTGVTPNDDDDPDGGANGLQNFPVVTSVADIGGQPRVNGSLNSVPDTIYRLDFYHAAAADPSGHGEGNTWLGFTMVTTDAGGNAPFSVTLPVATPANRLISVTATNPTGNTSEFSAFPVAEAPSASLQATNVTTPGGTGHTFDVTYTDNGAMNLGTIDGQDILVRLPGGSTAPVTLVGTDPAPGGSPVRVTYRLAAPGGTFDPPDNGTYAVLVQAGQVADTQGNFVPPGEIGTFMVAVPSRVMGRHVFYNNSWFDTVSAANPDATDDEAIAPDKTPLLPGQTAGNANYTSYSKGLNGIIVDVDFLPNDGAGLTAAAAFTFRAGNDNTPANWPAPAAAATLAVRPNAGTNGADRVVLTWPDNAVRGAWLQVTVLGNAATGLAAADAFYYGNAPGDTFNSAGNAPFTVNSLDVQRTRINQFQQAPITSLFDHDKSNNIVNSIDVQLSRINQFTTLNRITVPLPTAAAGGRVAGVRRPTAAPSFAAPAEVRPRRAADDVLGAPDEESSAVAAMPPPT